MYGRPATVLPFGFGDTRKFAVRLACWIARIGIPVRGRRTAGSKVRTLARSRCLGCWVDVATGMKRAPLYSGRNRTRKPSPFDGTASGLMPEAPVAPPAEEAPPAPGRLRRFSAKHQSPLLFIAGLAVAAIAVRIRPADRVRLKTQDSDVDSRATPLTPTLSPPRGEGEEGTTVPLNIAARVAPSPLGGERVGGRGVALP